jgi:hypothetical protein
VRSYVPIEEVSPSLDWFENCEQSDLTYRKSQQTLSIFFLL